MKTTFRDIKIDDTIYIIDVESGELTESKITFVKPFTNFYGVSERQVHLENGDLFQVPAGVIATRQNDKEYYVSENLAKDFLKERYGVL